MKKLIYRYMINVIKNSENKKPLRLLGLGSISGANYLFELSSEHYPNKLFYFTCPDISSATCEYNLFNFIETGSSYTTSITFQSPLDYLEFNEITQFTNLTASTFHLDIGEYTCNIYESTGATYSLSATTGIPIYTDIIRIIGLDNDPIDDIYK